jgi:hypothetical protein
MNRRPGWNASPGGHFAQTHGAACTRDAVLPDRAKVGTFVRCCDYPGMTAKGDKLKRAAELENMAETASSQLEKDALLRVAQRLLDQDLPDEVRTPARPRKGGRPARRKRGDEAAT